MDEYKKAFSKAKCPYCGKDELEIVQRIAKIPHFGEVLEVVSVCKNCMYRYSSILSLEQKEPIKIKFLVENENDLEVRIIKSQNCKVEIPELGIEIKPGTASEGYISNVEGLFERIEEVLKALDEKKVGKLKNQIKEIREGKKKITIIFTDKSGVSSIVSDKAKKLKYLEKQ